MQSITKVFNGVSLDFVRNDEGDLCLSAEQIGQALGYSEPRSSVLRIVARNADEFEGLQGVVKLTTPGGEQEVTVFAEEGIYLVGMKASTKQAKAFRKFVAATLKDLRKGTHSVQRDPLSEVDRMAGIVSQVFPIIAGQITAVQQTADDARALAAAAPSIALEAMRVEQADAAKLRGAVTKKVSEFSEEALRRGFCEGNKRRAYQEINTAIRDRFGVRENMPSDVLRLVMAYLQDRFDKLTSPNTLFPA